MPFRYEIHQNNRAIKIFADRWRVRTQPPPYSECDRPLNPNPFGLD